MNNKTADTIDNSYKYVIKLLAELERKNIELTQDEIQTLKAMLKITEKLIDSL